MALECVVVMPVYNEAACIREVCAEWLLAIQAHGKAALLVVDDGSNDGTGEILDGLAANQPFWPGEEGFARGAPAHFRKPAEPSPFCRQEAVARQGSSDSVIDAG